LAAIQQVREHPEIRAVLLDLTTARVKHFETPGMGVY
jgi:hypothetical protein